MTGRYHRGESILIEAELKKIVPFGDTTYSDPDGGVQLVIEGPSGSTVVSVSMYKQETGKYYYVWQTDETLSRGLYTCKVTASDSQYSGFAKITNIELV